MAIATTKTHNRKLRNVLLACGAVLSFFLFVYPFLSGKAQKSQNQEQKTKDQESVLEIVRRNVVANSFYETLQEKETGWVLTKAISIPPSPCVGVSDGNTIFLILQKDKAVITVTIIEYNSVEEAKMPLRANVSQGTIEECKGEKCGDEGRKIYREGGDFSSLRFRKYNFYVSLHCNSEEVAECFAGYVLSAIANK
jgi:leucyl aminopeptidase